MFNVKGVFGTIRRYVSPVYITMLVASFILWYITKLGDTYTTDHEVTIVVESNEIEVDCTIRGKGTDLIGYTLSSRRSRFEIPASEIVDNVTTDSYGHTVRHINNVLLQQALAARMSDIDIVSVGAVAPLKDEHNLFPSKQTIGEDGEVLSSAKYDVVPATLDMPSGSTHDVDQESQVPQEVVADTISVAGVEVIDAAASLTEE